jgi:hypothetical protein
MRTVRLFSAAMRLDPLAVAPERVATVATYLPFDSSTLPEYCVPPTVVEKLVCCISSAALLLALAPPEAWPEPLRAGATALAVLAAEALEAIVLDAAGVVAFDAAAAFTGAAATGFKTIMREEVGAIADISIAVCSRRKCAYSASSSACAGTIFSGSTL